MNKKIYISARFNKKEDVIKLGDLLTNRGFEVISNWVSHKSIKPYEKNQDLAKQYSIEDINNSAQCDYFILLTSDAGTGMYVEIGAAIQHNIEFGKPVIYVVGNNINRSMFYFHPTVNRLKNIEDLIAKIK